jgi:hypothetical protein
VVLVLGFSRTNLSLIGSGLLSFLSYGFLSGHDHGFVELLLLSGWSYLSWYGVKLPWWLLDILLLCYKLVCWFPYLAIPLYCNIYAWLLLFWLFWVLMASFALNVEYPAMMETPSSNLVVLALSLCWSVGLSPHFTFCCLNGSSS